MKLFSKIRFGRKLTFIRVGSVNDWHVYKGAFLQLNASKTLDEVTVHDRIPCGTQQSSVEECIEGLERNLAQAFKRVDCQ